MKNKIILIQGAMDIEIEYFLSQLKDFRKTTIAEYDFYEGTINNINVVVSKTHIGTINATTSTAIGIMNFNPDIVINQGIAGAHRTDLHTGDIVIGEKCCNINDYEMPSKTKNEGSNSLEWKPSKRARKVYNADLQLVNVFEKALKLNYKKTIYKGTLGSGDAFNREIDRIEWIANVFGSCSEDMESIGTYSVCNKFNVPCIGVRIISNNEILSEGLNEDTAIELQRALVNILSDIIN